ncbi:MAG: hypothetical protein KGN33_00535 [Paracoccaceae bacterium]|nr:hypothetical protein [Paracoccaceae bacterium]
MKIIYHLGLHCTDERRLERNLRRNTGLLAKHGIVIPDPDVYKPMLKNVVNAMHGAPSSQETEETVLDSVMVADEAERIVFLNESFLCVRPRVLSQGALYAMAPEKVMALVNLLPSHEAEIAFAIRNLATFLPALFQSTKGDSFDDFLSGVNIHELSWASMVGRIRAALPDLPMTIWCDEDTPLIWPEVMHAVSGAPADLRLKGQDDVLASILAKEGMDRLSAYLADHPEFESHHRHRAIMAFLDKYALPDQVEMEIDLPGWDEALVEQLSANYDSDLNEIAEMPGVTLIEP